MAKEKKEKHFVNKPVYEGGPAAMKKFIAENKKFPPEALEAGVEGTVVVRYTINHKGVVTDAKVISGPGHGCNQEAIRLVKLLRFNVAKNRGVRAVFHKTIKIHFRKNTRKAQPTTSSSTNSTDKTPLTYQYTLSPTSNSKEEEPSTPAKSYTFQIRLQPKSQNKE